MLSSPSLHCQLSPLLWLKNHPKTPIFTPSLSLCRNEKFMAVPLPHSWWRHRSTRWDESVSHNVLFWDSLIRDMISIQAIHRVLVRLIERKESRYFAFNPISTIGGGSILNPTSKINAWFLHFIRRNFKNWHIQNINMVYIFHLVCFLCRFEQHQQNYKYFSKPVKVA